jgi:hypothetical protein
MPLAKMKSKRLLLLIKNGADLQFYNDRRSNRENMTPRQNLLATDSQDQL